MSKIGIFMADGCEEIEGLTVVDIVRRAGIDITTISISDKNEVAGAHGITFLADAKRMRWTFPHWMASYFRVECREQQILAQMRPWIK